MINKKNKICPILNRECIKEECVLYGEKKLNMKTIYDEHLKIIVPVTTDKVIKKRKGLWRKEVITKTITLVPEKIRYIKLGYIYYITERCEYFNIDLGEKKEVKIDIEVLEDYNNKYLSLDSNIYNTRFIIMENCNYKYPTGSDIISCSFLKDLKNLIGNITKEERELFPKLSKDDLKCFGIID